MRAALLIRCGVDPARPAVTCRAVDVEIDNLDVNAVGGSVIIAFLGTVGETSCAGLIDIWIET